MAEETRKLGTFEGVFVPTTLTILGVILFTRTGWTVANGGLAVGIGVIALSYTVSMCTALSMSSITTNMQVGGGGAFGMLTRTLGIEPGGSIGIPLYLSQSLAVVLYIFGFREGWLGIFPGHPAWAVDGVVFLVVFSLASISARLAFRLQYAVLAVIAGALVSLFAGLITADPTAPSWGPPADGGLGFWDIFAVFFPAVTGIMAGVNLSGDLRDPQRSIPKGALWATGLTFGVYVAVAVTLAVLLDAESLRSTTSFVKAAAWSPAATAGLLGATFSSALSSAVGAPRILEALASQGVIPRARWLARRSGWGEPVAAIVVTALLTLAGGATRQLDGIAPFITLFFLLTYGALNATLLIQQGLRLPRFRPTFRVPLAVPMLGLLGCIVAMVAISPLFTAVAAVAVLLVYAGLARYSPEGPYGQVRAGILFASLMWALGRLQRLDTDLPWQARVLLPLRHRDQVSGILKLLRPVIAGGGSLSLLRLSDDSRGTELAQELVDEGFIAHTARSHSDEADESVREALALLEAGLVPPNTVVIPWREDGFWQDPERLSRLSGQCDRHRAGLWLVDVDARRVPFDRIEVVLPAFALDTPLQPSGLALVLLAVFRLQVAWDCSVLFTARAKRNENRVAGQLEAVVSTARIRRASHQVVSTDLVGHVEEHDDRLIILVPGGQADGDLLASVRAAVPGRVVCSLGSGAADDQATPDDEAAADADESGAGGA